MRIAHTIEAIGIHLLIPSPDLTFEKNRIAIIRDMGRTTAPCVNAEPRLE
jgi:hypothetical protein